MILRASYDDVTETKKKYRSRCGDDRTDRRLVYKRKYCTVLCGRRRMPVRGVRCSQRRRLRAPRHRRYVRRCRSSWSSARVFFNGRRRATGDGRQVRTTYGARNTQDETGTSIKHPTCPLFAFFFWFFVEEIKSSPRGGRKSDIQKAAQTRIHTRSSP